MKVSGILANNGIKLLSGLANNDDALTAMIAKDWIGDAATVYTYKKNGGKDDGREKTIEEFGTGAVWLFGIPAVKKIIDKTVYPLLKLNSKFDPRVLDNKETLKKIKELANGQEKEIFDNLDKANPVIKKLTNAQMYKTLAIGKFVVATLAAAWGLTKIIKYKQKTTTDRIEKDKQNKELQTNKKDINLKSYMESTKRKDISFTGGLAEFMYNPIKNTMILDGVITGTRLKEARKGERGEVLFKEACQIGMIYLFPKAFDKVTNLIGKMTKCPIGLDPKNLFKKDLGEQIQNASDAINALKNSDNFLKTLKDLATNKNPIIELLENEGVISLTNNKELSFLNQIDKNSVMSALDNLKNMGNNIGNLGKSKALKTIAVISNVLLGVVMMGIVQPKITIWLRKKIFGSNENPAIVEQEKNAKINT
ncbi:MAG: hypothetical protein IKU37_10250 [Candidatus Gastranaerophilales bacterium]|nr:hypothetical protein [Candidatus Gastranaerophilales bacterium]